MILLLLLPLLLLATTAVSTTTPATATASKTAAATTKTVAAATKTARERKVPATSPEQHQREYKTLYDATEDKDSLEAIRDLHRQLDDDNDGAIEPSETGDFIRADLHYSGDRRRQRAFHDKDAEITVKDLWLTWRRSEVYNWTVEQVVDWLENSVELPQYADLFGRSFVNGTQLPKVAVSPHYLAKVVGVTNPIHRSKITLKAMDVVLFGPPRDHSNFWKDMILTSLLMAAVTGLMYAYWQNKRSKAHVRQMMSDMESLAKAEETLKELQEQLNQRFSEIDSLSSTPPCDMPDAIQSEISRLKEELEVLRGELHQAELELEDKCWLAPPVLQHWLQLTYEMESLTYNTKKKAAEEQLEMAKDMCERLKRKSTSLVGAFISTHTRSIEDVDRSILEARQALTELTKALWERTQRWRQIEMLCGCPIIQNPGLAVLQNLVRHVGAGGSTSDPNAARLSSRLSSSVSQDDPGTLDDLDSRSVAASAMTAISSTHRPPSLSSSGISNQVHKRSLKAPGTGEESSSSCEDLPRQIQQMTRATTPPAPSKSPAAAAKRLHMVKSFSQDAGCSIAVAVTALSEQDKMAASRSEGHLQKHLTAASSGLSLDHQKSQPSIAEESCSASDSGSLSDLVAKKKRRSFFNLKKKKDKKNVK